ncbi:IS66 family insertion sequence element accessory protein TnpB [Bradyrhizobium ottawaense]|uniref:IS66 family insertion sequence element accessory protein TnpB n=1 Tax=Bradyrhizobium ottawaense TaxID=931866 RepID=UPI0015CF7CA4|nr:IS66 family insertion sequence element accessory protein TnpB [Bradyrhizobium ottawaense]
MLQSIKEVSNRIWHVQLYESCRLAVHRLPATDLKIYVATRPIDFRCGHDGLAAKVQEMLRLDPFSGAAFVFRSNERIGSRFWSGDRTGLVLVHKRLEGCKFVWPTMADGVMRMSPAMFAALFEGLDWRLVRPEEARCPQAAG